MIAHSSSVMRFLPSLSLLAFLLTASVPAADWPQFRGPDGTAVAPDAEIPTQPKIDWSVPLPGRGLASPIIVGHKLFVTCASGPKQERLHLFCLDTASGGQVWERQLQATGRTMCQPKNCVAASSPCSDGRHIFALWSSNDLAAFDLDGNLLWVRGLTADYPNASNSLGMASSPIVIGETVVTMIENDSESYSLGIDVATGRNLWKLDRPKAANWTSPVPWRADAHARAGRRVAIFQRPPRRGPGQRESLVGIHRRSFDHEFQRGGGRRDLRGFQRHHRPRAAGEQCGSDAALAFEANQPQHHQPLGAR